MLIKPNTKISWKDMKKMLDEVQKKEFLQWLLLLMNIL